jgi:glutathione peroxidase-family protein
MKKILGLLSAFALMGSVYAQSGTLALGTSFPDQPYHTTDVFTMKDITLRQASTKKGLLVVFTCNTCPFVIRNIDRTKEILDFAKEKGLGVMMVNSNEAQRNEADAVDKMIEFGKKQGYPNYYVDKNSDLADIFGASHTPEVFLFDGKTETLIYKGAMDDNPSDPKSAKVMYLKNAITNMLAGKTIDPAETKSVGCSIKRVKS